MSLKRKDRLINLRVWTFFFFKRNVIEEPLGPLNYINAFQL